MNWEMVTAIATFLYALLFFGALLLAYVQTMGFEKNRKFQAALTIWKELQTRESLNARRYIYEGLPEDIKGLDDNQLKSHIQKAEKAFTDLDMIGYLAEKNHIDITPILEKFWAPIWKCWQKSRNIVYQERGRRSQEDYLNKFEYLFCLTEDYRLQNQFPKPKVY